MTKQERLNTFVIELAEFLEKYYSSNIDSISGESNGDWLIQKILGPNDSVIELWTENNEITIIFGEAHWHIYDYNVPCDYESIYENTINGVLSILRGELCTASYWLCGTVKGGGTMALETRCASGSYPDKKGLYGLGFRLGFHVFVFCMKDF